MVARRALACATHLPTSPLALGRALDDPREVEQLNAAVLVIDHTRNAGERRELVRRLLRLGRGKG